MNEARFYIDHDTIHDRITGKHVRTDPDFGPGRIFGEDGREECCRLLNSLAVDATVCIKCREPHDGSQWATCEHCSVARTKNIANLQEHLGAALRVIESFRPLAHAAKAIADDGWPDFPARGTLAASLEERLDALKEAYDGIADMVADADAEATPRAHCRQFGRGCGLLQEGGTCVCTCSRCAK